MKKGIYILTIFLISCTSNHNSKKIRNINNLPSINSSSSMLPDSLHDYRSYYYLSNLSTPEFADLYLKDSIMTNDYKKLYDCLDSLSSNNANTRYFYFKVLINSLDKPEVVFHQQMGAFLVKNIDKFKNEFPSKLLLMNNEEIKFYAQGIEFYLSNYSKMPDKGDNWIKDLKLLEEKSTPEELEKLILFFKEIDLSRKSSMSTP